jgi:hypothetical protein
MKNESQKKEKIAEKIARFYMTEDMFEKTRWEAFQRRVSMSQIFREGLELYFKLKEENEK